jgi:hypothetical protein
MILTVQHGSDEVQAYSELPDFSLIVFLEQNRLQRWSEKKTWNNNSEYTCQYDQDRHGDAHSVIYISH